CTWPTPTDSLEENLFRLDRMRRVLARYDDAAPTRFYEVGLMTPTGAAAYDMPRHEGFVHDGTEEAMALVPAPTCASRAVTRAYRDLIQWLLVDSSPGPSPSAHQVVTPAWVGQRLSLIRSGCA